MQLLLVLNIEIWENTLYWAAVGDVYEILLRFKAFSLQVRAAGRLEKSILRLTQPSKTGAGAELGNKGCESLPPRTIPEKTGTHSCATPSMDWEDLNFEVGKSVEGGGGITLDVGESWEWPRWGWRTRPTLW